MLLCITSLHPSALGNFDRSQKEVISKESNATRATPALVDHLYETASEEYRKAVLKWWLEKPHTVFKIQNGSSDDYWVWC